MKDAKKSSKSQREKFIEVARKHGASEDEAVFDENLKQIARTKGYTKGDGNDHHKGRKGKD